ncbi:flavoprotein [Amycolatopsis alba]|uniref:flavoprotein n=1 Tax=Amycolatopsis alba TaxID=76020 RepID=UPI00037113C9|nr:flavoprotein [Amycolatopsis alba]
MTAPDVSSTKLLLGVCGSVSAVGTPHLLMWLRTTFGLTDVRVILSDMAQRFVTKQSLAAVADYEVVTGWDDLPDGTKSHVGVAADADVLVVMPATAHLIAQVAHGLGGSLLTSVIAAATCPTLIVPSMSEATWLKPATQRNVTRLRDDGFEVIEPAEGFSTSGSITEFGSLGDFRAPLVRALTRSHSRTKKGSRHGDRL